MNDSKDLSIKKYQFISSEEDVCFLFDMFYSLALEKNIFIEGPTLRYKIKSLKSLCYEPIKNPDKYIGIINKIEGSCFLMRREQEKGFIIFSGVNNKNIFSGKRNFFVFLKMANERFGIKKFYSDASDRNNYDKFILFLEKYIGFKKTGRGGDENYELIYE